VPQLPKIPTPGEMKTKTQDSVVWKSIFRPGSIYRKGYRDTSRDRALAAMNNVLYHLHPVKVKRHGLKLTYTYCLGGLSFFLFILLTVTGIFLMFFYRPAAGAGQELAYLDMQNLHQQVAFGELVRNMHRWGAHLMVLTVFLHMARVFYHGAYKPPREFNWVVGMILLVLTLLAIGFLALVTFAFHFVLVVFAGVPSYREIARQGSERADAQMTPPIETVSRSANFSSPSTDAPSNPTDSPASASARPELRMDRSKPGASRPVRLDREKYEQVGRMIAVRRNAIGRSQEELALAVGQSTEFIASVENGSNYIHPIELLKISKAISLDLYRVLETLE
jgi:ribosome-binding protein aMBF1 (putative translation factor)